MRQNDASQSNGHRNGVESNGFTLGKRPIITNGTTEREPQSKAKPKRNKCDLGTNFVAPDGGWGWMVLIAAGCSNVSNKKKR